ncbi:MAG: N-acetylmuramoyl-L-alanine amidase, partial [Bacteroidia bacterium]
VASVVENKLIGVVGNCLVMPVAPGLQLDPTLDDEIDLYQHYYADPLDPVRLSLPTKGVFAEAVMGKCNSCEKKDETRFWRWDEAPIPDSPTTINAINTPVPQNVQQNLQAKDFAAPIINLQNAPNIPDPQGYGGLVQLLGNPNIFRDLTGLSENQKNALQAFQTSMTGAQNFASMSKDLATQQANQANSQAMVEAIRNAPELTKEEKAQLIKDHFKQMIDGGESKRKEQETTANNGKTGLSDVAARAEEKGKAVKASSVDPATGKVETLEVGEMVVDEEILAEAKGTIAKLKQSNPKACWATAATIMVSWKRNASMKVETVLEEAGDYYLEKYQNGEGLRSSEKDGFIGSLGMIGEAPASYPMQQYIDWLTTYGPIWVTTDSAAEEGEFSPHARILFKITGTALADEKTTQFVFINPTTGNEESESFETFLSKFEQMATDNTGNLFKQIVRFSDVKDSIDSEQDDIEEAAEEEEEEEGAEPQINIHVKNAVFENEGVPNCTLTIENTSVSGMTNNFGKIKFDMASLPDNQYTLILTPDYLYTGAKITDLGDPTGNHPNRIFAEYRTRISKLGELYTSTDPNVIISGNNINIKIKPIWMKIASSSSRRGVQPSVIIIHHTDDANQRTRDVFNNGVLVEKRIIGTYDPNFSSNIKKSINSWMGSGTAPHYVIDRDGSIIKLGHEKLVASHAGVSRWKGQRNNNSTTIGIEVVHTNNVRITPGTPTKPKISPTYTEQYTHEQYLALISLLNTLTQEFNISHKDIFGHSDIATNTFGRLGRKSSDPGRQFDWTVLQNANLSLAPATGAVDNQIIYRGYFANGGNQRISAGSEIEVIRELQNDLISIGYSCNANGIYDDHTRWAVAMLLQHYENVDGKDYVNLSSAILIKRLVMNL